MALTSSLNCLFCVELLTNVDGALSVLVTKALQRHGRLWVSWALPSVSSFGPLVQNLTSARTRPGKTQGSVGCGFQTVVRVFWGNEVPLPPFYLNLTSFLPQFYLLLTSFLPLLNLNLTSASSRISNHGLETTVYRLLEDSRRRKRWKTNGEKMVDFWCRFFHGLVPIFSRFMPIFHGL